MQTLQRHQNRGEYRQPTFLSEHTDPSGRVRPDLWRQGIEYVKRMNIAAALPRRATRAHLLKVAVPSTAEFAGGVQWTQIGPAPLRIDKEQNFQGAGPDSGEVTDVAIDPQGSSDQTIYIATNDGGVWKSTDGGTTWLPKTDFMPSLSMGAVVLAPGNSSIVYAGTGNLFDGGRVFSKAIGIYKSIDAGETWSIVGTSTLTNLGINRIVLPASNILLVATNGGLFRSVDGGLNFGANASLFNDSNPILSGFISDLALDTASPSNTVYACIAGQGIFKSTDGGVTFPVNLFSNPGAPSSPYAFIAFTQSTLPDNQTMYASIQDSSGYKGLFKSTDGGANWSLQPDASNRAAENGGAQLGYDQTVGVDPQDPNRVYIGFQELYVSTNGGANFGTPAITRNKTHWDHHVLVFSPRTHWGPAPTQMYIGTDGGVSTSTDGGNNWSNLNEGIATNIFLGIDIGRGSSANNAYTYGGTQDTGTIEHQPGFPGANWHLAVDGDGGPVAVDPNNPLRAYGSDDGNYIVTSDGGNNWSFPGGTGLPLGVSRFAVDPNNGAIVYATTGSQLFQSTDTGATFTSIQTFPANIASIATVALGSNTLWVGLQDGTVQQTTNALAGPASTWTSFSTGLPIGRSADSIAIDPSNTTHVVVAYSGFSGINPVNRTQHVFQTLDGGATWNDISGMDGSSTTQNLPDLPLHAVVINPGTTNEDLLAVTWSGSQFIIVGLLGAVFTSPDGIFWTQEVSGVSNTLFGVTWSGSQFVTVGDAGTVLTSLDGITWSPQTSGTVNQLNGVTWSGSQFVAVGDAGTILTSLDGITWSPRDSSTTRELFAISWLGSQFVATGGAGMILTSPDGITWITRASGVSNALLGVTWSGSQFVTVGDAGTVLTSLDGVTWSPQTSGTVNQLNGVTWSGSQFVAVGDAGTILTSLDGITWSPQTPGTSRHLHAVISSGSQLVAVGNFVTILASLDGITWTREIFGLDPTSIIVASDAAIMITTDFGASWQVLGVGLPTVDCKSLALDISATPALLRVGTYGRSVFELTSPAGPRIAVLANLAFGAVRVGTSATLTVQVFNVGSSDLTISSFTQIAGSADFQVSSGPSAPVMLLPGEEVDYTILYQPSSIGSTTATFQVNSNDPSDQAHQIPASGTGV